MDHVDRGPAFSFCTLYFGFYICVLICSKKDFQLLHKFFKRRYLENSHKGWWQERKASPKLRGPFLCKIRRSDQNFLHIRNQGTQIYHFQIKGFFNHSFFQHAQNKILREDDGNCNGGLLRTEHLQTDFCTDGTFADRILQL